VQRHGGTGEERARPEVYVLVKKVEPLAGPDWAQTLALPPVSCVTQTHELASLCSCLPPSYKMGVSTRGIPAMEYGRIK
jgi:hypothetical protein